MPVSPLHHARITSILPVNSQVCMFISLFYYQHILNCDIKNTINKQLGQVVVGSTSIKYNEIACIHLNKVICVSLVSTELHRLKWKTPQTQPKTNKQKHTHWKKSQKQQQQDKQEKQSDRLVKGTRCASQCNAAFITSRLQVNLRKSSLIFENHVS